MARPLIEACCILFLGASKTGISCGDSAEDGCCGWMGPVVDHQAGLQRLGSTEDLQAAELITEVTGCRLAGWIYSRKWADKCSQKTHRKKNTAGLVLLELLLFFFNQF